LELFAVRMCQAASLIRFRSLKQESGVEGSIIMTVRIIVVFHFCKFARFVVAVFCFEFPLVQLEYFISVPIFCSLDGGIITSRSEYIVSILIFSIPPS
jgi:hypothetical protein